MNEAARKLVAELKGVKQAELVKRGACGVCHKPLLEGGGVTFYLLTVSRAIFDPHAIRRRIGLEMMLGNGPLAKVMGPDEDIAKIIDEPRDLVIHEDCAMRLPHLLELHGSDLKE